MFSFFFTQAKLEARKNRRQQEAKRQGGEEAAQRILDEHSRLALQSKPTGVEYINIPNVVAGQSPEEQVRQLNYSKKKKYVFIFILKRY